MKESLSHILRTHIRIALYLFRSLGPTETRYLPGYVLRTVSDPSTQMVGA